MKNRKNIVKALLALVGWDLYRLFATRRFEASAREMPLEVLRHRYARGELSTEEYEERRQKLRDQDREEPS